MNDSFTGDMAVIDRLLTERGFQLARGTYHPSPDETLPTVVVKRPDTPGWQGEWMVWYGEPNFPGDVPGEVQAALEAAGKAIAKWDADVWMFHSGRIR